MRKILLFAAGIFLVGLSHNLQAQCETNGDFENWETIFVPRFTGDSVELDIPENWLSIAEFFSVVFGGVPNTFMSQSSDAYSGNSSLQLVTPLDTTITDALLLTDCDMKYTKISGYYKWDGQNGDALVTVGMTMFDNSGDSTLTVAIGQAVLSNNSDWTKFESDIIYAGPDVQPDTIVISIVTRSDLNETATLLIDAIELDDTPSAIDDHLANEYGIKVYPNPTSDRFQIQSNNNEPVSIDIIDVNGRWIRKDQTVGVNEYVDISNIGTGTYFVYIRQGEAQKVTQIIKR